MRTAGRVWRVRLARFLVLIPDGSRFIPAPVSGEIIGYVLHPEHPAKKILADGRAEDVLPRGPCTIEVGPLTFMVREASLPPGVMLLAGQNRENAVALLTDGRVVDVKEWGGTMTYEEWKNGVRAATDAMIAQVGVLSDAIGDAEKIEGEYDMHEAEGFLNGQAAKLEDLTDQIAQKLEQRFAGRGK